MSARPCTPSARSIGSSFASVSRHSASATEPATMPAPACSVACCPVDDGTAERDAPLAVAACVDPPDRARVAAARMRLERGDRVQRGVARHATDRGRRMERGGERVRVRSGLGEPPLDRGHEVPDRRELHDARALRDDERRARRRERGGDGLRDRPVLPRVLLGVVEAGERVVAVADDGPRHRTRLDLHAAASHQQLGGRADEPLRRVDEAAGLLVAQAGDDPSDVDRTVRRDVDPAGQHDLLEVAALDDLEGAAHDLAPLVVRGARLDGERTWRLGPVGTGGHRRRELRDPAPPVGQAADDPLRDDEPAGLGEVEGERADGERAGARRPHLVVVLDRREERRRRARLHEGRHARGDEADPVLDPGEPVGGQVLDEVVPLVDRPRHGAELGVPRGGDGHARVPVRSCTDPPIIVTRSTSVKPAAESDATSAVGSGRYAVDFGRYRYASASCARSRPMTGTAPRNQTALPARSTGFDGTAASSAANRPPDAQHASDLREHGRERDEVAQREPADDAVERRRCEREDGAVAPHQRRGRSRGVEHAGRDVDADRCVARVGGVAGQVARAAREIEHACSRPEREGLDGAGAPGAIAAEGDDPVDPVVVGRDAVEHLLDRAPLLRDLREGRRRCRAHACSSRCPSRVRPTRQPARRGHRPTRGARAPPPAARSGSGWPRAS